MQRIAQGQEPIPVREMDEYLEDYDLLDLVNAGILPAVVVDSHKAFFWEQVFPNLVVRQDLVVYPNNQIAWAVRKDAPQLLNRVNGFLSRMALTKHRDEVFTGEGLVEWYRNDEEGLAQGFTLSGPPASDQMDEPLQFRLELAGDVDRHLGIERDKAPALGGHVVE